MMHDRLPRVGFWKKSPGTDSAEALAELFSRFITASPGLPNVFDCMDAHWDPKERAAVSLYVADTRFRVVSYFGDSACRVCGKTNGSADFSDGTYVWPEGFAHYISDHLVRPPARFVRHVLRQASNTVHSQRKPSRDMQ